LKKKNNNNKNKNKKIKIKFFNLLLIIYINVPLKQYKKFSLNLSFDKVYIPNLDLMGTIFYFLINEPLLENGNINELVLYLPYILL